MSMRSRKLGNATLDVVSKGCFTPFETLACLRCAIITSIAGISLVFVLVKIYRYHSYRHKQIQHYAIFYITAAECILCIGSSIFGHWYAQIEVASSLLKLLQFSVLCQLHWSASARARCKEGVVQHVINPGLCLYAIYCLAVALMGMVDAGTSWNQCRKPYCLMLSVADFFSVQLFAIVAFYLSQKSSQRRDLLTVVASYEASAITSVLYDSLMRIVGTEEGGCSGVFGHSQVAYSIVELIYINLKFFVPIWALISVFQPVDESSPNEAQGGCSLNGTPTSGRSSIKGFHQYHRMTIPNVVTGIGVENTLYANNGPMASLSVDDVPMQISNSNEGFTRCNFGTMATISEEGSINYSDSINY